ncbi:hypothetical protein, partial [Klebsiella pneumoniae]|uniref:hypothetical protein n=1 Tax=Klebsiella pneumoniae TaxID=573 RepID=UPI001D0D1547
EIDGYQQTSNLPQFKISNRRSFKNNKSLQAGSVLPSGAYLQHLHHSDGSSSQGEFNISDLNGWSKMIKLRI